MSLMETAQLLGKFGEFFGGWLRWTLDDSHFELMQLVGWVGGNRRCP